MLVEWLYELQASCIQIHSPPNDAPSLTKDKTILEKGLDFKSYMALPLKSSHQPPNTSICRVTCTAPTFQWRNPCLDWGWNLVGEHLPGNLQVLGSGFNTTNKKLTLVLHCYRPRRKARVLRNLNPGSGKSPSCFKESRGESWELFISFA